MKMPRFDTKRETRRTRAYLRKATTRAQKRRANASRRKRKKGLLSF